MCVSTACGALVNYDSRLQNGNVCLQDSDVAEPAAKKSKLSSLNEEDTEEEELVGVCFYHFQGDGAFRFALVGSFRSTRRHLLNTKKVKKVKKLANLCPMDTFLVLLNTCVFNLILYTFCEKYFMISACNSQ